MAIKKVVTFDELGTYMDVGGIEPPFKINPVLPAINEIALATIPTLTGNTTNKNEFVKDSQGENWFIDYAGDGLKLGHSPGGISFFNSLSSVFPTVAQTNTTRVAVPGWNIPVFAGKSYKIEILATFTTAAANTGASIGLITSAGATGSIHGFFEADITNGTVATTLRTPLHTINTVNTTVGSFMTTTGTTLAGIHSFNVLGVFNCTASGNMIIQWGTEVANNLAQLRIGSSLIVTKLN